MVKAGSTVLATDFIVSLLAGEALAALDAVYIDTADGKLYKCDSNVSTKVAFAGFAQEAASLNAAVNLAHDGHLGGFSGLTIGGEVFLSETAGLVTQTAPVNAIKIGYAQSATIIKLFKNTNLQVFTASGTYIKPHGAKSLEVICIGGGAGGNAGSNGGNPGSGGAGVDTTVEVQFTVT